MENEKKNKKRKCEVKLKTRKGSQTTEMISRLKTWKGGLGRRKLIKGSQGMEPCDNQASPVVGKQSLTYARKGLKTSAKRLFLNRAYSLLAGNISNIHYAVFLSLFVHTSYSESINEKSFCLNNLLPSFATSTLLQMRCAFYFIA